MQYFVLTDRTRVQHAALLTHRLPAFAFSSLSLLAGSQLCSHPLAKPSAGAASAFANQKQPSFTGADPAAACLAALAALTGRLLFAVSLAKHVLEPFRFTGHGDSCRNPTTAQWLWPSGEWDRVHTVMNHCFCFALLYLLYVTSLHMHWSTYKTRSSTSYRLPATNNQQMLGSIDYVFAAQPVRHHMISVRGLSLVTLGFSLSTPHPSLLWGTQQASSARFRVLDGSHTSSPRLLRIRKGSRCSLTEFAVVYPNWHQKPSFIG